MSISEVTSFCLYFHELLQQNQEHTTSDLANKFLLKAIHQYKFQSPPQKVEDFWALVIREGKEKGSKELKYFFKKMDKLLIQKKYHRRLLLKEAGLQHQSSMPTMNGIAERAMHTITEHASAML